MPKIGDRVLCPNCGSQAACLGGAHYEKIGQGMGHEAIKTAYQCSNPKCKATWIE